MLHVQLNGEHNASNYSALLYTHGPQMVSKGQNIFSEEGHVPYQIKLKTCRTLCKFDFMHTPDILGWIERSDIEIVQISIFYWAKWMGSLWLRSEWYSRWTKVFEKWDLYFTVNILSLWQELRWAIQGPWALLLKL